MFTQKETNRTFPDLKSLPVIRRSQYSSCIQTAINHRTQHAASRMVGYVSVTRKIPVEGVTVPDILVEEVEEAILHYGKQVEHLISSARALCRALGNTTLFPYRQRVYPHYHPLVKDWVQSRWGFDPIESPSRSHIRNCMVFLRWLSTSAINGYKPHEIPVIYIQRAHVIMYRQSLINTCRRGQKSRATAKRQLQDVVQWLRWMQVRNHIGNIDLRRIALKRSESRERRVPGNADLIRFFEEVCKHGTLHDTVLFTLLLATGSRPIEIRRLTFDDINAERRAVYLQSKSGPGRWIPLSAYVWDLLQNYLGSLKDQSGLLFRNTNGQPLTRGRLWEMFVKLNDDSRTHIDGLYAFRHRFATDCLEQKVPTAVFQYFMGHKGLSELARYQHANQRFQTEQINEAFESAPWLEESL